MKVKFFSLTISEFFLRGSKFLFFLALTNFYSQDVVSEYGYFTALFSILFVLSDFGYQTYLTKELSQNKSFSKYIESINIALFRVIFFIIVSFVPLVYYLFTTKKFFLYIFLLFLIDTIASMNFTFYRAYGKYYKEIKLKFMLGVVFVFTSCLTFFGLSIYILFSFLTLVSLVYALYEANYIQKKYFYFFYHSFSLKNIFISLEKSLFIFLASIATITYLRIDILILEWFNLENAVIYYTIASRVLELTLVIPAMISAFLLPRLVQMDTHNHRKELLKHFIIGVGVMLLFLLLSNSIITLLFPKYTQTTLILNILLFSIPFMLLNNYGFTFFVAKNLSKYYFFITFVMLISNLTLNIIFIQEYGYKAAAYTTLGTEFLGSLMGIYILKRYQNFD